ncbi:hypothetical protein HK102_005679, partial [Quaeritorhiza haematococci]
KEGYPTHSLHEGLTRGPTLPGAPSEEEMEIEKTFPPILPLASAKFYLDEVMPRAGVHLGLCVNALQWLSQLPQMFPKPVGHGVRKGGVLHYRAAESVRAMFSERAMEDWRIFLSQRAIELAPHAKLMVVVPGVATQPDQDDQSLYMNPKRTHNHGFASLLEAGLERLVSQISQSNDTILTLDKDVLDRIVLPCYYRTVDELKKPLVSEEAMQTFYEICDMRVVRFDDPDWMRYQADGDRARFARRYVEDIVRPLSEAGLLSELIGEDWRLYATGTTPHLMHDLPTQGGTSTYPPSFRSERFKRLYRELDRMYRDYLPQIIEQDSNPARFAFEHSFIVMTLTRRASSDLAGVRREE